MRVAGTDYLEGGWTLEVAVEFARRLAAEGVDLIDVMSTGGAVPDAPVPWGEHGLMTTQAARIRREARVLTGVSFMSTAPDTRPADVNAALLDGSVDLALLGRAMLRDPYWPIRAAEELGRTERLTLPSQYEHWLSGRAQVRQGLTQAAEAAIA